MKIGALVLTAGGSSKLGRPKQLIKAEGKNLLEKAIGSALEAGFASMHVVLGARFNEIKATIEHLPVGIIRNENWQEGIGSSIRTGVEFITARGEYEACWLY